MYIGQTKRHLKTTVNEHEQNIRYPTRLNVISNHIISEDHVIEWESTRIMNEESNYGKRFVAEMVYIKKKKVPRTPKRIPKNVQKSMIKLSKKYNNCHLLLIFSFSGMYDETLSEFL